MDATVWLEFASKVGSVAIPLVGTVFTIYFKRAQDRQAAAQYIQSVREAWLRIDEVALTNPLVLRHMHSVLAPSDRGLSDEQIMRKWAAYMILNAVYLDFLGAQVGLGHAETMSNVEATLQMIVAQTDLYPLTQTGYRRDFHALARRLYERAVIGGAAVSAPSAHPG
ncbi:MAG: hypothetical protein U1F07_02040 [Rubrivivax sp.]